MEEEQNIDQIISKIVATSLWDKRVNILSIKMKELNNEVQGLAKKVKDVTEEIDAVFYDENGDKTIENTFRRIVINDIDIEIIVRFIGKFSNEYQSKFLGILGQYASEDQLSKLFSVKYEEYHLEDYFKLLLSAKQFSQGRFNFVAKIIEDTV
jgi:hypothetical protein